MKRRHLLGLGLAPMAAAWTAPARAGAWPERTLRLVVPYAPGGGPDVLTRQYLPRVGKLLGQTVVVDNRVGAGGSIAAEHVAAQAPDGYSWLLGASTHVTQKLLQPRLNFDPVRGFAHVTRLSFAPSLLVVSAASPYRSLQDLVRAAHEQPGRLNYGSGGIGSAAHLAGAALAQETGMNVAHIPYRGSVDLPGALAAGDVHFAVPTASTALPLIRTGRLLPLAVTSAQRVPLLPNVPTLKELVSSDDLVLVAWTGLWLPGGTPPAILRRLFEVHQAVYAQPDVVEAHAALGVTVSLSNSASEFSEFVSAETAKYARIVKASNIQLS